MNRRRTWGLGVFVACLAFVFGGPGVAASAAATVTGTISAGSCPSSEICDKLPAGDHFVVSVDMASRVKTVSAAGGHFSVSLAPGYDYKFTAGVEGSKPDIPVHFTPEDKTIKVSGDESVNFSWSIYDAAPEIAKLDIDNVLVGLPLTSVTVLHHAPGQFSSSGGMSSTPRWLEATTPDIASDQLLYKWAATGRRFRQAVLVVYHRGTHRPAFTVDFYEVTIVNTYPINATAESFALELRADSDKLAPS